MEGRKFVVKERGLCYRCLPTFHKELLHRQKIWNFFESTSPNRWHQTQRPPHPIVHVLRYTVLKAIIMLLLQDCCKATLRSATPTYPYESVCPPPSIPSHCPRCPDWGTTPRPRTLVTSRSAVSMKKNRSPFQIPSIPDKRTEDATRNVVRVQPHLKYLAKHFPENREPIPVLLLVWTIRPGLFTRPVGSRFPFVHHTGFGRSLVGPVCRGGASADGGGNESSCYRMSATEVGQSCEYFSSTASFPVSVSVNRIPKGFDTLQESPEDDLPGISKDDAEFLNVVENGTHVNQHGNPSPSKNRQHPAQKSRSRISYESEQFLPYRKNSLWRKSVGKRWKYI